MVPQRASQNFQTGGQVQPVGGLLESQERAILEEIARLEMPHSQRASVLLALDTGASQAEAGEQAGMTARQARYWRDRFVQHRLDIFPQDLLAHVRVGPLPEERALISKQEGEVLATAQEEPERMTDEPPEPDKQPEEQEQEEVAKKTEKSKSKKKGKGKKDKKRKKGKKKKSAKKAGAKEKSAKSKKKRRKK